MVRNGRASRTEGVCSPGPLVAGAVPGGVVQPAALTRGVACGRLSRVLIHHVQRTYYTRESLDPVPLSELP